MRFSELDGASVGVWGAGREVRSFADHLSGRLPAARITVAVFDGPPPADARAALHAPEAILAGPDRAVAELSRCDAVIRSPGVSIHRPELLALQQGGTPITTATGLWLAERGGAGVIGITGTKGKSTTAALTARLCAASGVDAALAGNIGVPALDLLDHPSDAIAVVELSSFQIADLEVGPQVAVVTNLYREHLDWHGTEESYRADKLRLLGLPGVERAVLPAREAALAGLEPAVPVLRFGDARGWDVGVEGVLHHGRLALAADQLPLRGEHNLLNVCAAASAVEALGIRVPPLGDALAGFAALPHRLQTVAEDGGVTWVDDSISTTPESALAALASFPGRELVLIGGGQDRGQDYGALGGAVAARQAIVIGIPTTGPRLVAAARAAGSSAERAIEVSDLAGAVALARELAGEETVVLLSPAAPSFDSYGNFEQRGEHFGRLIREG